ncbi:hypothetical protein BC628DRAFT_1410924 [Trametes gibbosa]|nr:hypothetical protein BC628DRAFT_1410924 [Trametes gibbosa]
MAMSNIEVYVNDLILPTPPYKDPAAGDVIIRTSDGVELNVLKSQLASVGLDSNGLLSQMRPTSTAAFKPTITVPENSALWDKLLRVCLLHAEQPYTLDDIVALLEAGCNACGLQDTARIAAHFTHKLPRLEHAAFRGLQDVTGVDYFRLLVYRTECGEAARKVTVPLKGDEVLPGWIAGTPAHWRPLSMTCIGPCAESCRTVRVVEANDKTTTIYVRVRQAWLGYLEELGDMLVDRPDAALAVSPDLLEPVVACAVFSKVMEAKIADAVGKVRPLVLALHARRVDMRVFLKVVLGA